MGPRRWSRGRVIFSRSTRSRHFGFNGATAMEPWKRIHSLAQSLEPALLQWGHGDGAVEETTVVPSVVSLIELQWGHGDGAVEEFTQLSRRSAIPTSFNGATAMEPWKSSLPCAMTQAELAASMGPRRWSRGRGGTVCGGVLNLVSLQWGHGDGAVEEAKMSIRGTRPASASMGPRRWSRGRAPSTRAEHARSGARFNGATAMEPWKSGKQMTGRTIQRRFNGATAMEPWKRLRKPYIPRTKSRASMGPRRWSRGRGYASRGCQLEGSGASMGPRRWSRGRELGSKRPTSQWKLLQWGHGDGAVEESIRVARTLLRS